MKTAATIMTLLTACILGCSYEIRPYTPLVILNGFQNGVQLGTLNDDAYLLNDGEYYWIYIKPGYYQFTGMFDDSGSYRGNGITTPPIQLEPGKTYYFQVIQQPARSIQDIILVQHDNFTDISSYKSSLSRPKQNASMSLVYFYYKLPSS